VRGNQHTGPQPLAPRFWAKVLVKEPDECWEWQAGKTAFGYGRMGVAGHRLMLAHRISWELANGPILDDLKVLHRCDNPPCVNPAHLFLGTTGDNNRDCDAKGRRERRGSHNGRAILDEDLVERIRWEHYRGQTQAALARKYGVGRIVISAVVLGRTWTHCPGPIVRRGRFGRPPRISEGAVRFIRARALAGEPTRTLAEDVQTTQAHIRRIIRRERRAAVS
jgi:hypothetical protein